MRGRAPIPVSSPDARLSLDSSIRAPVGSGAEVAHGLGTGRDQGPRLRTSKKTSLASSSCGSAAKQAQLRSQRSPRP